MNGLKISSVNIKRFNSGFDNDKDLVVVEEPLEIRLIHGKGAERKEFSLSVTMRTPGNDFELAVGFLYTEGIITSYNDIREIRYCETVKEEEKGNVLKVSLTEEKVVNEKQLQRHFYTTSSCGVCGKSSLESLETICSFDSIPENFQLTAEQLLGFNQKITDEQLVFKHTGGIHAATLVDDNGNVNYVREDIGRHNAVDKVIGAALKEGLLPLHMHLLLVSGRAGYELVQKAIMAGVGIFAAVGAPSNLAINVAVKHNMTLIGFLRDNRFNIYHGEKRIKNRK